MGVWRKIWFSRSKLLHVYRYDKNIAPTTTYIPTPIYLNIANSIILTEATQYLMLFTDLLDVVLHITISKFIRRGKFNMGGMKVLLGLTEHIIIILELKDVHRHVAGIIKYYHQWQTVTWEMRQFKERQRWVILTIILVCIYMTVIYK